MHLLKIGPHGEVSLTDNLITDIPPYAILSHTWGSDNEEVTFKDLKDGSGQSKAGYTKIRFCADQTQKDDLQYFWIDTCCIDKTNLVSLAESIVSMFRWYQDAQKCYVFLSDVSAQKRDNTGNVHIWESTFRTSRWFTRGWTLQELLAPRQVEFYSREGVRLGDKTTLERTISEITGIPETALRGRPLREFTPQERMRWASGRETKRTEDKAYCLLGIFNVSMPVIYGEGDKAFDRLKNKIAKEHRRELDGIEQVPLLSSSKNLVAPPCGTTTTLPEKEIRIDRRKTMLASLGFEQMESRQSSIKNAYSTTCQWLLKHPAYVNWIDPQQIHEHRGFLWINGKPGAGKSTLMKFALSQAYKGTSEGEILLSFFFNARGDQLEYSTAGLYRALLFQLLTKIPNLQDLLDDLDALEDRSESSMWTREKLCELLSTAVTRLGDRRLTCFIDALDECEEQQIQEMIIFFEELGQDALHYGTQLYICFASRHYPTIDIQYGRQLTLETEDGHAEDLGKYVQSHLRAGKAKSVERIRTQIREKANGVFLWAVLVVPMLNDEFRRGRIWAVQKRLEEIPARLSDLFKEILSKDSVNMNDLLLCLQWVLFAERPLRREEFYFAMTAGLAPDSEYMTAWESDWITEDDMNRFVLSSSKGLAELTRSKPPTVQFIHESVRDFLLKDKGLSELWPDLEKGTTLTTSEGKSHECLRQCCLNYLSIDVASHLDNVDKLPKASTEEAARLRQCVGEKFPFLEYAVRNVLWHADKAQAKEVDQSEFIRTFQLARWVWLANLVERHETRRHTQKVTLLYILAENNLSSLIRVHPSNLSCFDVEGERYGPPIFAALATASDEAVQTFLQIQVDAQPTTSLLRVIYDQYCHSGNKPNHFPRTFTFSQRKGIFNALIDHDDDILLAFFCACSKTALKQIGRDVEVPIIWAAKKGHVAMVKLLLERGANVESEDRWGQTPLSLAAGSGHEATVKLLLEHGANIESKDSIRTPLSFAAGNGHEAIAKLLLERGANVKSEDRWGQTPLSFAAQNGHEAIVKLLLEHGANIESKDSIRTPLSLAAGSGHEAMVKLLLEHGANIESKDSIRTPLSFAAENGHEAIMKLLLEHGANVESKDCYSRIPLSFAAKSGHEAMVKLLLDNGADRESKDKHGRTPLWHAAQNGHEAIVKLLLEYGANIESEDSGRTPLSIAAEKGYEVVVKLLLEHGTNVEFEDYGRTPLSLAAEGGHEVVVKLLLDDGADRESKDYVGKTPLIWAAIIGNEQVVRLLLEYGAERYAKDKYGKTPLQYAIQNKLEGVVKLLMSYQGEGPPLSPEEQSTGSESSTTTPQAEPSEALPVEQSGP
ncbi:hypothetical protein AYO21_10632 [Fonsecaea monophora]|uniref:Uncharacterized protein n=1 Tax=Fonsecaea monophora TaxID=254056 RepID=A0A177ET26_9EURO|nr:hypothetical protein AYO21_10632 [Fonsecaea monophora]OAG35173.1 hypothetical protein AYO21_10632 [Fonsecaea monophora]